MTTVKAALFSSEGFFLREETYTSTPRVGDYIEIRGQSCLSYKIEAISLLSSNSEGWDIALVIGTSLSTLDKKVYFEALYSTRDKRLNEAGRIFRDRKQLKEPNEVWQRKRSIYERIEAAESVEDIAKELGIKPARVKQLRSEWASLKQRNHFHDLRERELLKEDRE